MRQLTNCISQEETENIGKNQISDKTDDNHIEGDEKKLMIIS